MDTYKEKYKEALERAIKAKNNASLSNGTLRVLGIIFPELKENDSEKIRKELIDFVKSRLAGFPECDRFIAWLEKQGEQKPQGKTALEAIKEEKVDNQICVKGNDKAEPKFKVKYAGSEYNVFETKNIAGVPFYGIEDEPNHIDYVQAENCEIISGYAIKENSSLYPTKPAVFSEKKPAAWSEEDTFKVQRICKYLDEAKKYYADITEIRECMDWLKSLINK